jgi:hypothetical protein
MIFSLRVRVWLLPALIPLVYVIVYDIARGGEKNLGETRNAPSLDSGE